MTTEFGRKRQEELKAKNAAALENQTLECNARIELMGIQMSEVKGTNQCAHYTTEDYKVYLHGMPVAGFKLCESCLNDWHDYDNMVTSKRQAHAHKKDAKLDIRQLLQQMSDELDKL